MVKVTVQLPRVNSSIIWKSSVITLQLTVIRLETTTGPLFLILPRGNMEKLVADFCIVVMFNVCKVL